jgi:hypothetical protein
MRKLWQRREVPRDKTSSIQKPRWQPEVSLNFQVLELKVDRIVHTIAQL